MPICLTAPQSPVCLFKQEKIIRAADFRGLFWWTTSSLGQSGLHHLWMSSINVSWDWLCCSQMGFYCLRENKKVFGCLQINVLYSHCMYLSASRKRLGLYWGYPWFRTTEGRFMGKQKGNLIKLKLPYKRTRIDWLDRIFGLTLFSSGRIMFSINVPQKALRLQIKQKQHEDWNILALLLVFKSCNFLLLILRIYKILHILLSCSFQQCPYFYIYTGGVPSALQTHSLGL